MIDSIITSKTRIQILLRFFLNPERSAYLRELAAEIGESSNGIRVELNRLAKSRLIECTPDGRTKSYKANRNHPLFPDIQSIVKKTLGIDKLIDEIVARLGDVKLALVTGDYARGIDGGIIDLVLVGDINREFLDELIHITEPRISNRKIRTLCLSEEEYAGLAERLKREKGILEIFRT
jgi:hypothetical protein